MQANRVEFKYRLAWLGICYLLFGALYSLSGYVASQSNVQWHVVFEYEYLIPFIPVMVVPYLSSGLLFVAIFFICTDYKEFYLIVSRIVFITVVACAIHLLLPLSFSWSKPEVSQPLLKPAFEFISTFDTPFNELPSLHIAYSVIYWTVTEWCVKNKIVKNLLKIWIGLIFMSVIFVFQHHIIDVFAALALMCVANILFHKSRNSIIGNIYMLGATLSICLWMFDLRLFFGGWIALCLTIVGNAYFANNPYFLKRRNGKIRVVMAVFLAPYMLFYIVSRFLSRYSKEAKIRQIYPHIYVGARIGSQLSKQFFADGKVTVFDLSAELPENSFLMTHATQYKFRPLLDIAQNHTEHIEDEILEDFRNGNTIFIHCTMGHSRSVTIATKVVNKIDQI